jgi:hypothetical protein
VEERVDIIESSLMVSDDEYQKILKEQKARGPLRRLPPSPKRSKPLSNIETVSAPGVSSVPSSDGPLSRPLYDVKEIYTNPAYATSCSKTLNSKKLTQYFGDTMNLYKRYMSNA